MTLQRVAVGESFAANLANVRTSLAVDAHVQLQLLLRCEQLATLQTRDAFFFAVITFVVVKYFELFGERHFADFAIKLSRAAVELQVKIETLFERKRRVTDYAFPRFRGQLDVWLALVRVETLFRVIKIHASSAFEIMLSLAETIQGIETVSPCGTSGLDF